MSSNTIYFGELTVKIILKWKQLNLLNNIHFLKISYLILIGVPIISLFINTPFGKLFQGVPLTLKLGYVSSIILSLAHMLYQGFCPNIIKRFDSPNDLYRDMLEIKALQMQYLSEDTDFEFNIIHCREGFDKANNAHDVARLLASLFYYVGVFIFLWIIIERTKLVLFAY